MMKKKFLSGIYILLSLCTNAQPDSQVFRNKVISDSISFRKNVLPKFQDDDLYQSVIEFVSKQQAIVYEINGTTYKGGFLLIIITDSAGKFLSGVSMFRNGQLTGMNPSYTTLPKKVIKKINKPSYGNFEPSKFESWSLGASHPTKELIYKIENGQVISAIFFVDAPPGYFNMTKSETSYLYQVREELYNHLYKIKKETK